MNTNTRMNYDNVVVSGIVCNTCGFCLPTMTMSEHLDSKNPKNKCKCDELPCVGCGEKEIKFTEMGGEKGVNMCRDCFGGDGDEYTYTCDTCGYDLDMDDLIHGYHDQSVYQCADCYDKDEAEDGWIYMCRGCKVSYDLREQPKCDLDNYCCECCWKQDKAHNTCDCPVCLSNPKPEPNPNSVIEKKTCVVCDVEKSYCEIGINCKTCKNSMCFVCCCEYSSANPHFECESDETGTGSNIKIPCAMCRTINVFCV